MSCMCPCRHETPSAVRQIAIVKPLLVPHCNTLLWDPDPNQAHHCRSGVAADEMRSAGTQIVTRKAETSLLTYEVTCHAGQTSCCMLMFAHDEVSLQDSRYRTLMQSDSRVTYR